MWVGWGEVRIRDLDQAASASGEEYLGAQVPGFSPQRSRVGALGLSLGEIRMG